MTEADLKLLFGKAIKRTRSEIGISQEELADRAGLHRTYISDVERGARNLSLTSIEKLAGALHSSISKLFTLAVQEKGADRLVRILLVDDNMHDVQLTLRAFDKARIVNPVDVARDGAEALEFLFGAGGQAKRRAQPVPGVVLLDLCLPKIDGIEVLRQMKANRRTAKIPVVVLTGSSRHHDIAECKRLGAESYIVKPVGFQNFSEITPHLKMEWALVKPFHAFAAGFPDDENQSD
jgi:CheY-like chemotaxis protein